MRAKEKARELMATLGGGREFCALEWDSLAVMKSMKEDSVDLVLGSPPYEDARVYGAVNFSKKGQEWVDWLVPFVEAAARISKGLAVFVVGHGKTTRYSWSATPCLLMADLHRKGISLRCPLVYARDGVFGSGGKDYFRYNYEFVVVAQKKPGRLPWCNNCAGGKAPRYAPGGGASNRTRSGARAEGRRHVPPVLANPGTVFQETYTADEVARLLEDAEMALMSRHVVGGGHMGHALAHENEAPYPLSLAERYVLSFCPPGGVVLDPFMGSGTTLHAAVENKRRAVGVDLRADQVAVAKRRLASVTPNMVVMTDEEEYERRMGAEEAQGAE